MSYTALLGVMEIGLVYGLVALGAYLSFRVLEFPDLTADGSFPLGAAVASTCIVGGWDPYSATLAAFCAGSLAGAVTAFLNIRFQILHLLASILTMTALYTINLRIMGKPNQSLLNESTVLTPVQTLLASWQLDMPETMLKPLFLLAVVAVVVVALSCMMTSQFGLAMRATGINPRMAQANGISTHFHIYVGMALSNALIALGGALYAQTNGFADATMGIGTIIVGLAAVIVGETLFAARTMLLALTACVLGSILYRFAIALAMDADFLGFSASDLNLVTAALVALALILPRIKRDWKAWGNKRRQKALRALNDKDPPLSPINGSSNRDAA